MSNPLAEARLLAFFRDDPETLALLNATRPPETTVEPPPERQQPSLEQQHHVRRTVWSKAEREHRAAVYCEQYEKSVDAVYMPEQQQWLWDRWCRAVATRTVDELMTGELEDVAAYFNQLCDELDALKLEVAALRAEVAELRAKANADTAAP